MPSKLILLGNIFTINFFSRMKRSLDLYNGGDEEPF